MTEQWRPIPGFEGRYDISDLGRARSWLDNPARNPASKPYPMKATLTKTGYLVYSLGGDNSKQHPAHRLVMLAFVGPSDLQVNHKNGDRADNRLENLEYCTPSQNRLHAVHVLGHAPLPPPVYQGESHPRAKLTDAQVEELRKLAASGVRQRDLVKMFGISKGHVSHLVLRRQR